MAFGRKIKLFVGNFRQGNDTDGNALDLSELDIDFEITRSIEWYDNEATITIYNPSPSTINTLMNEGNSVILQAGYEDQHNLRTIFSGQIATVAPQRDGKDIIVVLTCAQARGAFYQLARLNLAVGFSKDKTIKSCLQDLCDYAGIVLRAGKKKAIENKIGVPFRASGTFIDVIERFSNDVLFPYNQIKIYLDNNELIVKGLDNTIELEEIFLNYDSGLLECKEIRDENLNKVNFGDDPSYYFFSGSDYKVDKKKEKAPQEIERVKRIHGKSLMNPAIVPNCFIQVDTTDNTAYSEYLAIKGRFIVTECNYKGGNTLNDFTVEFDATEAPYKGGSDNG